jgi:hypothetical protein
MLHQRVQPTGRLIEDQQLDRPQKGEQKRELAPVAAGEQPGRAAEIQPEALGQLVTALRIEACAQATDGADQLRAGHPVGQARLTRDVGQPRAHRHSLAARVLLGGEVAVDGPLLSPASAQTPSTSCPASPATSPGARRHRRTCAASPGGWSRAAATSARMAVDAYRLCYSALDYQDRDRTSSHKGHPARSPRWESDPRPAPYRGVAHGRARLEYAEGARQPYGQRTSASSTGLCGEVEVWASAASNASWPRAGVIAVPRPSPACQRPTRRMPWPRLQAGAGVISFPDGQDIC